MADKPFTHLLRLCSPFKSTRCLAQKTSLYWEQILRRRAKRNHTVQQLVAAYRDKMLQLCLSGTETAMGFYPQAGNPLVSEAAGAPEVQGAEPSSYLDRVEVESLHEC